MASCRSPAGDRRGGHGGLSLDLREGREILGESDGNLRRASSENKAESADVHRHKGGEDKGVEMLCGNLPEHRAGRSRGVGVENPADTTAVSSTDVLNRI